VNQEIIRAKALISVVARREMPGPHQYFQAYSSFTAVIATQIPAPGRHAIKLSIATKYIPDSAPD